MTRAARLRLRFLQPLLGSLLLLHGCIEELLGILLAHLVRSILVPLVFILILILVLVILVLIVFILVVLFLVLVVFVLALSLISVLFVFVLLLLLFQAVG